ncbi:MAG TPA: UpxY family transcription antiterminator [Dissulfurispiraceae bacterium]|nr:UpxY family transcription antiterminator [Dissulfurispiraceae bacterium]
MIGNSVFKCWYAVHVRSRHEFRVFSRLAEAGIEAFVPVVERLQKWSDRKKIVEFPLFPSYLFVYIPDTYDNILAVLKKQGVVRFLGMIPGRPEPVPEEQIDALKKLVSVKNEIDPYPYLKQGQQVKVKRGPLKGAVGMLTEKAGQHLFVVSIDILQQGVAVKIDASDIEAL